MKTEVGSLTVTGAIVTDLLVDSTLTPTAIWCQVYKNGTNVNSSTGYSDGVRHRCGVNLDDTIKKTERSSSYCVMAYANVGGVATKKVSGYPEFATGEVIFHFDTYDSSYSVDYIVIGN